MWFGWYIQKLRCMGHGATHSDHVFMQGWILFLNNAENERKTIFLASLFCLQIGTQEERPESIKPSHVISAIETVMKGIIWQQCWKAHVGVVCNRY